MSAGKTSCKFYDVCGNKYNCLNCKGYEKAYTCPKCKEKRSIVSMGFNPKGSCFQCYLKEKYQRSSL